MMARVVSPYQMNPRGVNPLSDILRDAIDLDAVAKSPIKLFVTATSVRTGKGRVFRNDDLTVDALLASACLPSLFQAVEIEGEPYWDGGYSGNPTMTPLIRECESRDTILVQINPIERLETPRSAREILSRLNEVSFNAVLLKELRMMALLRKLALQGAATQNISNFADPEIERWAHMRVHRIAADSMTELGYSSKLNAEWAFLTMLRDKGRETADAFLAAHRGDLGERSTLDIDSLLEGI
jgi:NTE family protein